MNKCVCDCLGTGAKLSSGDDFRASIEREPEPDGLALVAQGGSQFVELDVQRLQAAEETRAQFLRMSRGTGQPGCNRCFGMSKDAHCGTHRQTFRKCTQDFTDTLVCGLEVIQGCVASHREFVTTGLATEVLNRCMHVVMTISHQRMDL